MKPLLFSDKDCDRMEDHGCMLRSYVSCAETYHAFNSCRRAKIYFFDETGDGEVILYDYDDEPRFLSPLSRQAAFDICTEFVDNNRYLAEF